MNNIKYISIFTILFLGLINFFLFYENTQFLNDEIFPWDSIVYKDLALGFFDNNYKDTIDYTSTLIYHPHTSKIVYPLVTGYIHKYLDLQLITSMFYVNLASIYFSIIIAFFLIKKFVNNNYINITVLFLFLIIWNAPLRTSFYNPAGGFAFDSFLISLFSFATFNLNEKKKSNLFIVLTLLILLSLQRFIIASFLIIVPIFIQYIKNINLKNLPKPYLQFEEKIKIFTLFLVFLLVSINSESYGSYSRVKFLIKFFYFHSNPFEFIYTYYYAYGSFFLIFIFCLTNKKIRDEIKRKLKILNYKQRNFFFSIIITSVILSTFGGDDSDRMLMWFFIWHLILFSICLNIIFKKKNYFLIFIFLITHVFGSRILTHGIPYYTITDTFLYNNQQTTTNFKNEYFQGPRFLKKFRNNLKKYKLETLPGIFIDNKTRQIDTYLPEGKIRNDKSINIYINAYKYRLNDIPFPIGYIHNQRNALIDHPWHGKWWVRFLFLLQWIFIQTFMFFLIRNKKIN